jgi:hypothetical protein
MELKNKLHQSSLPLFTFFPTGSLLLCRAPPMRLKHVGFPLIPVAFRPLPNRIKASIRNFELLAAGQ